MGAAAVVAGGPGRGVGRVVVAPRWPAACGAGGPAAAAPAPTARPFHNFAAGDRGAGASACAVVEVPSGGAAGALNAVLAAVAPGTIVRLGAGVHAGDVELSVPGVHVEPSGAPGSAVIAGDGGVARAAVTVSAAGVVLRGLRIDNGRRAFFSRGKSPLGGPATVRVAPGGTLAMEGCDVTCDASDGACVDVQAGAGPVVLARCAFQSSSIGVLVSGPRGGPRALVEDCAFVPCSVGLYARDGAAPHVRRCRFESCSSVGVRLHVREPAGRGRHVEVPRDSWGAAEDGPLVEDCVFASCGVGIALHTLCDGVVRHNTVRGCYEHGLRAYPLSSGLVEHNIVDAAARAPVLCDAGSAPVLRHNVVRAGDNVACVVVDGSGLFYGNALTPSAPGYEVNGVGAVEMEPGPCRVPAYTEGVAAAGDAGPVEASAAADAR